LLLHRLNSGFKTEKIVVVEIDEHRLLVSKASRHFMTAKTDTAHKVGICLEPTFLADEGGEPEVDEDQLAQRRTEHHVFGLNVLVHEVQTV
jgi:hypothetical protein